MNNSKKYSFSIRRLKAGGYGIVLTAIVIAVVVLINLVVAALPTSIIHHNTIKTKPYEIGDETKAVLDSIGDEVTMYYIVENGSEVPGIEDMLSRYSDYSSSIKVKTVDPAINPTFLTQYTDGNNAYGGVIVESAKRYKIVPYSEIYITEYTDEEQYYMMMGYSVPGTEYFFGEATFTAAIDYVTRDDLPKVYRLSGHGEATLDEVYIKLIASENITVEELNLMITESVPDDCQVLFIAAPKSDVSDDEMEKITAFTERGGDVILVTDMYGGFTSEKFPNIAKIAELAGLSSKDAFVLDAERYYQDYMMFIPILESSEDGVVSQLKDASTMNTICYYAHGIEVIDGSTATVTPIWTSSDSGTLCIVEDGALVPYGDEKTTKKINVAVQSDTPVMDSSIDDTATFIWYACPAIIDSRYSSLGNDELFAATLSYLCESTTSLSIVGKEISDDFITITEPQSNAWAAVIIIVIPVAILGAGFVVWFRRRRK